MRCTVALFLASCVTVAVSGSLPSYTNVWAVEVKGGKGRADTLAKKFGFENKGQVSHFIYPIQR